MQVHLLLNYATLALNPSHHLARCISNSSRLPFSQTGDIKSVQERLENGVVTGSYSLTEPDGSIRRVTYTADDVNGFNAVVERTNQPPNANTNNNNLVANNNVIIPNNNNAPFTIFT